MPAIDKGALRSIGRTLPEECNCGATWIPNSTIVGNGYFSHHSRCPYIRLFYLEEAIRELYYSAHWKSDRLTPKDEQRIFERLRDLAGLEKGHAPQPVEVITHNAS